MKVQVKVGLYGPGGIALSADRRLREEIDFGEVVLWFDQDHPTLDRILRTAANGPGLNLGFHVTFSEAELARATRFEPIPRRTLRLPDKDHTALAQAISEAPLRDVGGLFGSVRIIDNLSLSTVKIGPDQITMVQEGFPEYVMGARMISRLEESGTTGWRAIPIAGDTAGRFHPGVVLLSSDSFSGPAAPDPTVWRCEDGFTGHGWYWCLGCKVFPGSSLQHLPDFARSAEPLEVNDFSCWIVSGRVRTMFKTTGVREWKWRPVLELDSDLHKMYLETWRPLLELIRLNPRNHLG